MKLKNLKIKRNIISNIYENQAYEILSFVYIMINFKKTHI